MLRTMVKSAARRATAAVGQATDGFIWTTYIPAADAPAWHDGYPELHRNKPHPCEGCGKKYLPITYRHRWRCAPCAKDILDGVTIIDTPEYSKDYQPEPRCGTFPLRHIWRDELHTKVSVKPGGYDSANKLPTRPGFGHGISP